MSSTSSPTIRTLACAALLIFLVYTFSTALSSYVCLPASALAPSFRTATAASNMASPSHLHIALAQKSKSPPTVAVTVRNTHPSTPLTFVTWNTPLDPSALLLGTLVVTDPRTGAQLNKDTIKMGRKTPPAADQFVTLAPGESKTQDFELKAPLVPLDGHETVKVACRGAWGDVWAGERVGPESWAERSGKGVSGEFESEAVEVEL